MQKIHQNISKKFIYNKLYHNKISHPQIFKVVSELNTNYCTTNYLTKYFPNTDKMPCLNIVGYQYPFLEKIPTLCTLYRYLLLYVLFINSEAVKLFFFSLKNVIG